MKTRAVQAAAAAENDRTNQTRAGLLQKFERIKQESKVLDQGTSKPRIVEKAHSEARNKKPEQALGHKQRCDALAEKDLPPEPSPIEIPPPKLWSRSQMACNTLLQQLRNELFSQSQYLAMLPFETEETITFTSGDEEIPKTQK